MEDAISFNNVIVLNLQIIATDTIWRFIEVPKLQIICFEVLWISRLVESPYSGQKCFY